MNIFENFKSTPKQETEQGNRFETQKMLNIEFEKIEMACAKVKEQYGENDQCIAFIDYIRTIEKVFAESKIRNWDAEESKNQLIEIEMGLLADRAEMDKGVFSSVYDDFKIACADVSKITEVEKSLLEKYQDNQECCDLIKYIANLYTSFYSNEIEKGSMTNLKKNLIRARMNVISSDGNPALRVLENIYEDFQTMIKEIPTKTSNS